MKPVPFSAHGPSDLTSFILQAVTDLREPPPIQEGAEEDEDDDRAQLNGQWLPLELVRDTLLRHEGLLDELSARGVPLHWLEYPHGRTVPGDVPPDQAEIDALQYELARRPFTIAEGLALRLRGVPVHESALGDRQLSELTSNVWRTLGGVTQSIRSGMPRALRRKGEAAFLLRETEAGLQGHWETEEAASVDLRALFVNEGQLVGQLEEAAADHLAGLVWEDLQHGEDVLPGFHVSEGGSREVRLTWQRPVVGSVAPPKGKRGH
jgi:hypothetical protein